MFEVVEKEVRISVRELVEFLYRSGDIDSGRSIASQTWAMLAGSRLHKKIQKSKGAAYRAEVALRKEFERAGYRVILEGRADGILEEENTVTVDEIKGVYGDVLQMEEPAAVHLMQAMCYAYIYGEQNECPSMRITMTYVNLDDEVTKIFPAEYTFGELAKWMEDTLCMLDRWVHLVLSSREKRNESIRGQEFPFTYREGQRELVVGVYRTIIRKKSLFIQAPTGVGKTMAVVFPAVKAVGGGEADKLFYLTAKTITRTVAEEAFRTLEERGVYMKRLTVTAKEKICMCVSEDGEKRLNCNPKDCPYAKGFYDRVNDAVFDMVSNETFLGRETVEKYADKYTVCPFEMALDAAYWCDAVICDYNYVFDPNVYLKRFFAEGREGDYIFLIDEAHNLVERGRNMYSAGIIKEDIMEFRKLIKAYDSKLSSLLEKCNKALLQLKRQCTGEYMRMENAGNIVLHLSGVMEQMLRFSETYRNFPERERYNEFFFKVRDFLNVADLLDEKYVTYAQLLEDGRFMVKQYCVDPSSNLMRCMEKGRASILFSATLLPISYYRKLLRDNNEEDYAVYAHSAFDEANRCVLLAQDVTTRYVNRTEQQYRRVVDYILGTVEQKKGNYMVFFPSYGYMEKVLHHFPEREDLEILVQNSKMDEQEKEEFLQAFTDKAEKTLVGMCVLGGVFSEGIDLKEDSLIGAVIVGNGLPMVCSTQEILKGYFDERQENGFSYAYVYPGFNKVLQAAGRVIRTANDRGVILLLDSRFLERQYDGMFPEEWRGMQIVNVENFRKKIQLFWDAEMKKK